MQKMEKTFKEMCELLNIEVLIFDENQKYYSLKWGEGTTAKILGFKRQDIIKALNWADKNNNEADKIIQSICIS